MWPVVAVCQSRAALVHPGTMSDLSKESDDSVRPGLVLTAIGPDRPGLVKELASHVRSFEGNIEDTRMTKLGGEFAALMLITGSDSTLSRLQESLPPLESALGVTFFLKSTTAAGTAVDGVTHKLRATGLDRAGIVATVTDAIASQGANVASLASHLANAPLTGSPMFHLVIDFTLAADKTLDELEEAVALACEREDLEFTLE